MWCHPAVQQQSAIWCQQGGNEVTTINTSWRLCGFLKINGFLVSVRLQQLLLIVENLALLLMLCAVIFTNKPKAQLQWTVSSRCILENKRVCQLLFTFLSIRGYVELLAFVLSSNCICELTDMWSIFVYNIAFILLLSVVYCQFGWWYKVGEVTFPAIVNISNDFCCMFFVLLLALLLIFCFCVFVITGIIKW